MSKSNKVTLLVITAMFLSASATIQAKIALNGIELIDLLLFRFISGAILMSIVVHSQPPIAGFFKPIVIARSVLTVLTPALFLTSVLKGNPAESTAILFVFPLIVFVFYEYKSRQQIDYLSAVLVLISFIAVVSLYEFGVSGDPLAGVLALLSAITLASRIIIEREALTNQTPNFLNWHSYVFGSIVVLAWSGWPPFNFDISSIIPAAAFSTLVLLSTLSLTYAIAIDRHFNIAGLMYLEVAFVTMIASILGQIQMNVHNTTAITVIVFIGIILSFRQKQIR